MKIRIRHSFNDTDKYLISKEALEDIFKQELTIKLAKSISEVIPMEQIPEEQEFKNTTTYGMEMVVLNMESIHLIGKTLKSAGVNDYYRKVLWDLLMNKI